MGNGTAVITGATGGMGAIFAHRLAERGLSLVLVARHVPALEALASDVRQRHGVQVDHVSADLSTSEGLRVVEERVAGTQDLEILINAAGFGTLGRFAASNIATQQRMIELHAIAPTRLCHAALKPMLARHRGSIVNVSSVIAMLPLPGNVTYSGSKSYLIAFSQALHAEVSRSGIRVQALCPGFTRTGFHTTAEYSGVKLGHLPAFLWGTPERVVEASLAALERGTVVCIPGSWNKAIAFGVRLGLAGLFVRFLARGSRRAR